MKALRHLMNSRVNSSDAPFGRNGNGVMFIEYRGPFHELRVHPRLRPLANSFQYSNFNLVACNKVWSGQSGYSLTCWSCTLS